MCEQPPSKTKAGGGKGGWAAPAAPGQASGSQAGCACWWAPAPCLSDHLEAPASMGVMANAHGARGFGERHRVLVTPCPLPVRLQLSPRCRGRNSSLSCSVSGAWGGAVPGSSRGRGGCCPASPAGCVLLVHLSLMSIVARRVIQVKDGREGEAHES